MDNEKLFEFMEKIYSELQTIKTEMQNGFKGINEDLKKQAIGLDSLEKRIEVITEVQLYDMKQNEANHVEIIEMLTGEVELTEQVQKLQ